MDPTFLSGLGEKMDYVYRNYMYRKGSGPSNLSEKDENLDCTHPD